MKQMNLENLVNLMKQIDAKLNKILSYLNLSIDEEVDSVESNITEVKQKQLDKLKSDIIYNLKIYKTASLKIIVQQSCLLKYHKYEGMHKSSLLATPIVSKDICTAEFNNNDDNLYALIKFIDIVDPKLLLFIIRNSMGDILVQCDFNEIRDELFKLIIKDKIKITLL